MRIGITGRSAVSFSECFFSILFIHLILLIFKRVFFFHENKCDFEWLLSLFSWYNPWPVVIILFL